MQVEISVVILLTKGMEGFEQLQGYGFTPARVSHIEVELESIIFDGHTIFISLRSNQWLLLV